MKIYRPLIAVLLFSSATLTLAFYSYDLGRMAKVQSHYAVARFFFGVSAWLGDGRAQNNLAGLYAEGLGGPSDYQAAAKWFQEAANQGVVEAKFNLSNLYESGTGVPRDTGKAIALLEEAAAMGDIIAAFNAGSLLSEGRSDFQKDIPRAIRWYLKAADAGYASAQYNLGWIYTQGVGVPKDWPAAATWFAKAAAQGQAKAQMDLGTMLASGIGGTHDFAKGILLLKKAAGDPKISTEVQRRFAAVCNTASEASEIAWCTSQGFSTNKLRPTSVQK